MIDNGIVHGSKSQAVPLIINHDDVYVHTSIQKVDNDDGADLYSYDEKIYTRDEYTVLNDNEKNQRIQSNSDSIEDLTVMISELVGTE